MWLVWAMVPASADPPDQTVRLWPINTASGTNVERMAFSDPGESVSSDVLAGRTRGDLKGWLLDLDGWTMHTFAPAGCEVTGVAPILLGDETEEVWMSCGDGSVRGVHWDGATVTDVVDDAGAAIVFEGVGTTLSGIWYHQNTTTGTALLYAIEAPTDANAILHVIDPFGLTWDNASPLPSFPKTLSLDGFNEAAVVDDLLVISHGGQFMSYIQLGLDSATSVFNSFSGAAGCDDLHPSPFSSVYCVAASETVEGLGAAFEYRPLAGGFTVLNLGELINPNAISASPDLTDGWIAVTGTQVKVWEMDETGAIPSIEPYFEGPPNADNPIQDMVTDDGYLFGGGIAGNLHIVTARPWVYPNLTTVNPSAVAGGDTVTITFQVDEDVDWVLNLGGDRHGDGGTRLDSGTAIAETTVSVDVVASDAFAEGDNALYIVATNDRDLTGHALVSVNVDNPPDPPSLTDGNLDFADEALILGFDGISDADLDHYSVYVSTTPFTPSDWETGGPAYDGATSLKTPITLASTPGAHVTKRIQPLENEVTYYVAVRAWDQGGKEGPMSAVIQGIPHRTYSASESVGDPGGSACATGPSSSGSAGSWLGALGVGALAAGRRRRRSGRALAAAAAVGVGLGGATDASAQSNSDEPDHWWKQDTTAQHANFEVRYGSISLVDETLNEIYDESGHNILQAEIGPQFFKIGEVDLGFGFLQELSHKKTAAGAPSGERTMITWFPLSIDATLRAHILDEQPVVPYVRYGWDWVMWGERWDNEVGSKDIERGSKFGTHAAVGANILLDLLSPGRASFLEAQSGINDSWLTIEWRRQRVDDRARPWSGRTAPKDRLDFSGDTVTVGLKLDW
ncbi:MAG: MYXO-CTERM sorting domain-containing protein [Myxococcota bacterium]